MKQKDSKKIKFETHSILRFMVHFMHGVANMSNGAVNTTHGVANLTHVVANMTHGTANMTNGVATTPCITNMIKGSLPT